MSRYLYLGLVVFVLAMMLPITACDDSEEDDDPTVEEVIQVGKDYLISGDAPSASDAFHAALVIEPQNTDAKFGVILANTLQFTDLIDELLVLVSDLAGEEYQPVDDPDLGTSGDFETKGGPPIGDYIQDFLTNVAFPKFSENVQQYYELTNQEDFSFTLDGDYVVEISDLELLNFSGEFGEAELHFFGSVNTLLLAVMNIVLAHDINFNFANIDLGGGEEGDDDTGDDDTGDDDAGDDDAGDDDTNLIDTLGPIIELIATLLNDPEYPNFLYLDEDGVGQMQNAGLNLGLTFLRLNASFDAVKEGRSGNNLIFVDNNDNGVFDEDIDAIAINGLLEIDPALLPIIQHLGGDLAVAFFDTTYFDVDPLAPNPLHLASLNDILVYLEVLDEPMLGTLVGINVGPFFANPTPDGLRSLLLKVISLWDLVAEFL